MKVLLIDNFDSFTYNLYDYIKQLDHECDVIRNDVKAIPGIAEYSVIVLSPGPGRPEKAGFLMHIVDMAVHKKKTVLGICLGHQALGIYCGMTLSKATKPFHGLTSNLTFKDHPLFNGISQGFQVMRYHSLILHEGKSKDFEILARSEENEIMLIQHKKLPLTGMQFHPESVLTFDGLKLLDNWFRLITMGVHLCAIFFILHGIY